MRRLVGAFIVCVVVVAAVPHCRETAAGASGVDGGPDYAAVAASVPELQAVVIPEMAQVLPGVWVPEADAQAVSVAIVEAGVQSGALWRLSDGSVTPNTPELHSRWLPLARCESGERWDTETGNGFDGGVQYDPPTWLSNGGGRFAARANLATGAEQIEVSEDLYAEGGMRPWPGCTARWHLV